MQDPQNCLSCRYSKMSPTEVINASLQRPIKKFRCGRNFNIISATTATMYCAQYKKKGKKHANRK